MTIGRPFEAGNEGYQHGRLCGARRRGTDQACRAPAMKGRSRCRIHGGAAGSGGPPGNRSAFKHGRRSKVAIQAGKATVALLRTARGMAALLDQDQAPKPPRCC